MSELNDSLDILQSGSSNNRAKVANAKKGGKNTNKQPEKDNEESSEEETVEAAKNGATKKGAKGGKVRGGKQNGKNSKKPAEPVVEESSDEEEPLDEPSTSNGSSKKQKKIGKPRTTLSEKAGLQFPASRINRMLRRGHFSDKISPAAGIYTAAVLEYLTAEVLELAASASHDNKKKRIGPRHIQLAVRNDEELNKLLSGVTISEGGVLPNIHAALLPPKMVTKVSHNERTASQEF
ncbi:histone H2AX-like protein [Leptotrombidium deliense]|uniref:Histone H2A n=1 Tax=Leptotrombidium deliense TaxID=299467 RepID=A0A443SRT0_9ACAR|nr:histone H2AX-like protein [Leptotrombidium deliense]